MDKRGLMGRDGHGARWLCVGVVAAASALVSGCSPGDGAKGGGEPVETLRAALVDCSAIEPNDTAINVKQIAELGKNVVKAYYGDSFAAEDAIQIAIDILSLSGGDSVDAQIEASNEKLFCLMQALSWHTGELAFNNEQFAPVSAAWMTAQTVGFARTSSYDQSSHTATVAAGRHVMFERLYASGDPATDGGPPSPLLGGGSLWKEVLNPNDNDVPAHPNNYVFDWRIGLPRFMRLLAARIAMIGMMDPNFPTNGLWNPELGDGTPEFPGYRGVLTAHLQEMIAGVRCGHKDRLATSPAPSQGGQAWYDHTDVVCADVNTGLHSIYTYSRPDHDNCGGVATGPTAVSFLTTCLNALPSTTSSSGIPSVKDSLRRQVLKQMPIFEVQAAIDALYLYTHPAPDLTEAFGRIPLAANPGLCLDVPYGDPTPGNGLVVWNCNGGSAQQFSYDRETETIRNTALDRCIQVRPHVFNFPAPLGPILIDNLAEMAIAESTICDSARPDRQKWTYNPQSGVIRSALGTVLDVQWGNLQPGTPVWMADYNGSGAQIWRADHSSEYCSGTCLSQCNAACAGAGPGTGSCVASCMGSCVGNCMTTWP